MEDKRIIRVPLPVALLRSMDELISTGVGGFGTRAEFVREAIESQVLELTYESAPDAAANATDLLPDRAVKLQARPAAPSISLDFEVTAITPPPPPTPVSLGDAEIKPEVLYGLHNRDYPSIWAASQLASTAQDGPIPLKRFLDEVTESAWELGDVLSRLESITGSRLTPIFPTNREKPQSAEEGFQAFAIGEIYTLQGNVRTNGPLFAWGLAQLMSTEDGLRIGTTDLTTKFLEALVGLTAEIPHSVDHAQAFLGHLESYAPEDFWGFVTVLRAAGDSASRADLLTIFAEAPYEWTEAQVETNAAGFVSRCREWGLLEPRQKNRRYALTAFGERKLKEWGTT